MPFSFWVRRFLVVFCAAFLVLLLVALLRGRMLAPAATDSALWALASTLIFIVNRFYRSRRGQHCELCGDTPETGGDQRCQLPRTGRKD